ncbi:MAG: SDR family NAD(P)-dependent oxidoreductase, partial [Pseudomonadota bacterium]|nr:SDR family NAD(P)-dependent oxidoreductase [Pseudomonadota bacterium]
MSFDLGLAGKRVLVTGGTRGAGAATVRALLDAGARIVVAARSLPAQAVSEVHYLAANLSTAEGAQA